ncbi:hypothetical protein N7454_009346 [Penicillium verhagenii]|nr:hypothetical protein N7454_009346 [Penicillium verhagenii]
MMVFDPSLDSLSEPSLRMQLLSYFSDPVHGQKCGARSQPILLVSYQLFFLIADATKLARLARSLNDAEIQTWRELNRVTQSWHTIKNPQDAYTRACELYKHVIRILLLKSDPDLGSEDLGREIGKFVTQGIEVLLLIDKTEFFTSALAWLLVILGSVAVFPEEQLAVRDYLSIIIASSLSGQPAWDLERLENIWLFNTETPSLRNSHRLRSQGLQALLDG